jgi:hypothetical protein
MRRKVAIRTLPDMPTTMATSTATNAGIFTLMSCKVAKRTIPTMSAIHIASPSPCVLSLPQDEDQDIPAKKKARLEVLLITTAPAEAATEDSSNAASGDGTVAGLPAAAAAGIPAAPATADAGGGRTAIVTDRKSRCRRWTLQEDTTLTCAVQTDSSNNWTRIAALVPGRTRNQCSGRWHNVLDSTSTDQTPGHTGSRWTTDEDAQLKDAVQRYGGNNWIEIVALVPGRTKMQCTNRWHYALDPSVDRTSLTTGKWTADEDNQLKDAVQTHGINDWIAIAALVPGRTKAQCTNRWHYALDPSVDRTSLATGKWTADEDNQLKDAVQRHGSNNWTRIAALVPGRTKIQCSGRWHIFLYSTSTDPTPRRIGSRGSRWTTDEDAQLKDAVQRHGGNN